MHSPFLSRLTKNHFAWIIGSNHCLLTVRHVAGVPTIWRVGIGTQSSSRWERMSAIKSNSGATRCGQGLFHFVAAACKPVTLQKHLSSLVTKNILSSEAPTQQGKGGLKGWEKRGDTKGDGRDIKQWKWETRGHECTEPGRDNKQLEKRSKGMWCGGRKKRSVSSVKLVQLSHTLQSNHRTEPPLVRLAFISQRGLWSIIKQAQSQSL